MDDPRVTAAIEASTRHRGCTAAACFAEPCDRRECERVDEYGPLVTALLASRRLCWNLCTYSEFHGRVFGTTDNDSCSTCGMTRADYSRELYPELSES